MEEKRMLELSYKELLFKKIERYTQDEPTLTFVTILLTAGGFIRSWDTSFYDYKSIFGNSKFKEVKENLLQEGFLLGEGEDFCINLRILPSKWDKVNFKEKKEREQLLNELSEYLFQKGLAYYRKIISKVLSIPEGRYILQELAKVGPDLDEANIEHLSKVVGQKYFNEISKLLKKAGLLVYIKKSSYTHGYYRLFPPLISFFKITPRQEEALVFIYIAQNVRGSPYGVMNCGVLKVDVAREGYEKEAELLELRGEIKMLRWYSLEGFITTNEGAIHASNIIKHKLKKAEPTLIKIFEDFPSKVLIWLWQEVFSRDNGEAYIVQSDCFGRWDIVDPSSGEERFLCLLNDKRVKEIRDKVFETLIKEELAVKVHDYVSTKGGELRELVYVIPKEVKNFFEEFLQKKGIDISSPLFSEDMIQLHRFWHLGYPIPPIKIEKEHLLNFGEKIRLNIEELKRDLEGKDLIRDEGTYWIIHNPTEFLKEWRKKFFNPLVEYLFQKETFKVSKEKREGKSEKVKIKEESIERITGKLQVLLGKVQNREYFWTPLEEINPHLLIIGSSGTGKTQTTKAIIFHLKKQGIPAFVIDFANEYKEQDLVGYILKPGSDITINPLDIPQLELEGGPRITKFRVSGILRKIYRLGDQQEALVREAITLSYREVGILEEDSQTWMKQAPPFKLVKKFLEQKAQQKGSEANRAKAILNRLQPIFDLDVFSGKTQVPFKHIYKEGASLFLRDLPTEETKLATAEFFLRWLWHYILPQGEIRETLRLVIVLDEAHKLAYEGSPVADLLRQGRKYGLSCILSTQQPDDFESKELVFQNTSLKMAFGCKEEHHARTMAKQMDPRNQKNLFLEIHELDILEAMVYSSAQRKVEKVKIIPYFKLKTK